MWDRTINLIILLSLLPLAFSWEIGQNPEKLTELVNTLRTENNYPSIPICASLMAVAEAHVGAMFQNQNYKTNCGGDLFSWPASSSNAWERCCYSLGNTDCMTDKAKQITKDWQTPFQGDAYEVSAEWTGPISDSMEENIVDLWTSSNTKSVILSRGSYSNFQWKCIGAAIKHDPETETTIAYLWLSENSDNNDYTPKPAAKANKCVTVDENPCRYPNGGASCFRGSDGEYWCGLAPPVNNLFHQWAYCKPTGGACGGASVDSNDQEDKNDDPVNCKFAEWSSFSACNCKTKIQTRTRSIETPQSNGGTCNGPVIDFQACTCSSIQLDCVLSDWSDYSSCDCKTGKQTRTRTIINGGPCTDPLTESKDCACSTPVDCVVSPWGDYSSCSVSCGTGSKTRTRTVIKQAKNGGKSCPPLSESAVCTMPECVNNINKDSKINTKCQPNCPRPGDCSDDGCGGICNANGACIGKDIPAGTQNQQTEEQVLAAHNAERAFYGLPKLTWSQKLEDSARAWARNCVWQHAKNTGQGENLAMVAPKTQVVGPNGWFDEKSFWNCEDNTCLPGKQCGHQTQVLWATTTQVGCAFVSCPAGTGPFGNAYDGWRYMVCRYDPPGNIIGRHPMNGNKATDSNSLARCKSKAPCHIYNNRCGQTCDGDSGVCSCRDGYTLQSDKSCRSNRAFATDGEEEIYLIDPDTQSPTPLAFALYIGLPCAGLLMVVIVIATVAIRRYKLKKYIESV